MPSSPIQIVYSLGGVIDVILSLSISGLARWQRKSPSLGRIWNIPGKRSSVWIDPAILYGFNIQSIHTFLLLIFDLLFVLPFTFYFLFLHCGQKSKYTLITKNERTNLFMAVLTLFPPTGRIDSLNFQILSSITGCKPMQREQYTTLSCLWTLFCLSFEKIFSCSPLNSADFSVIWKTSLSFQNHQTVVLTQM